MEGPPKKGVRALRIKKKGKKERDAKPPAEGERKALRKRIILSNTNALEVPHLKDLSASNMTDRDVAGQVLGLPAGDGEAVDSLRAVEAFKVGQGWGYFRRPACLIRSEAVELARLMEEIEKSPGEGDARLEGSKVKDASGQTLRKLVCGERGVGKSVLLLQAMAMAFMRNWIVINLPEGTLESPSFWRIRVTN
jgi:small subunit ribosomal protein S29